MWRPTENQVMTIFYESPLSRLHMTLALALCFVICACSSQLGSQSSPGKIESLPSVVATVNARPIPTKLYLMYLKNGQDALGIDPNSDDGRRKLDQLREGVVSELIDRALIVQESERRGLSIPTEKLTEAEKRAIQELGGQQRYNSYLVEHGLSHDEYRDVIKQQIYGDLIRKDLTQGLTISAAEIKGYYEATRHCGTHSHFGPPQPDHPTTRTRQRSYWGSIRSGSSAGVGPATQAC
jgi:hypothetical protein